MSTRATFDAYVAQLPALLAALEACPPATRTELSKRIPKNTPGIYAFYHNGQAMYVGRTRDFRRRLNEHSRPSSSHYSASFSFLRAREAANEAGHTADLAGLHRAALAGDGLFGPLFLAEKLVVASMAIRWVVVPEAVTQALLEVYTAMELGTPFNSFETS